MVRGVNSRIGFERVAISVVFALLLVTPLLAALGSSALWGGAPKPAMVALGVLLVAGALFGAVRVAAPRLPELLVGSARRHKVRAGFWAVLALLTVLQSGRLSAFMANPANKWGSAVPIPKAMRHACMAAYVQAAQLSRDGDPNVYAAEHYPLFRPEPLPDAAADSPVEGLGWYIDDPYEYPPPFLVVPRAALALTNHFLIIRAWWFALNTLLVSALALLVASWIGGRAGLWAALLYPAVWISLPAMFNFQVGQLHLLTIALSMGAMVAFERKRPLAGGAMLAFAMVCKIAPGILLVPLLLQRRWREVGYTLAASAAFVLLGLLVLGTGPYESFFSYQLPRIASGEAFSFVGKEVFTVARNMSPYAIPYKLRILGLPIGASAAPAISWVYLAAVIPLAVVAARRIDDRLAQATMWLGLLNLGVLRSPAAPAYVTAAALWLFTLVFARGLSRPRAALLVVGWVVLMGGPPMGDKGDVTMGLIQQTLMLGLCVWAVLPRPLPAAQPALST
jgi:hypothetical protein